MAQNQDRARLLVVEIGSTAFSPDGRYHAFATCAPTEIWSLDEALTSGWEAGLLRFARVFGVCAASVRFSADGASLAVADGKTVILYDRVSRLVAGRYTPSYRVVEVSFTPISGGPPWRCPTARSFARSVR